MVKKKKDTLEDIMDRIQEEIDTLRDKVYDLENNQCECGSSDSEDDSEWDDSEEEDEEDEE
jgi:hypothetical protein